MIRSQEWGLGGACILALSLLMAGCGQTTDSKRPESTLEAIRGGGGQSDRFSCEANVVYPNGTVDKATIFGGIMGPSTCMLGGKSYSLTRKSKNGNTLHLESGFANITVTLNGSGATCAVALKPGISAPGDIRIAGIEGNPTL